MLNKFNHAIAPSQLMELDTALAEHELSQRQGCAMLIFSIDQSAIVVFCFDNNDLYHHSHQLGMLWCFMCTAQIIRLWCGAGRHGHGWVVKNTKLNNEWLTQPAFPAVHLELCSVAVPTGCASWGYILLHVSKLTSVHRLCQCKEGSNFPEGGNENDSDSALSGSDSEALTPKYK